jgi:hypothetical protein
MHWHYARRLPVGKLVKIGAWENDEFVGVVIFSRGASPQIAKPFGLTQYEVCELTRVALRERTTPTSKIVALALRLLGRQSPELRLVVSYADADQDHVGTIYQASNWTYIGLIDEGAERDFVIDGEFVHNRTVGSQFPNSLRWMRENVDPSIEPYRTKGKHKYVYPLEPGARAIVEPMRQPYPRAGSSEVLRPATQRGEGGSTPTPALSTSAGEGSA